MPKKSKRLAQEKQPVQADTRDKDAEELLLSVASLYCNSKYSDLTIICGTEKFAVHRCIVCPRSGFFNAACNSGFQESYSNEISLDGVEPALVKKMLQYLYTLDYVVTDVLETECVAVNEHDGKVAINNTMEELPVDEPPANIPNVLDLPETDNMAESSEVFVSQSAEQSEAVRISDPLFFHILIYGLADRLLIDGLKVLAKRYFQEILLQRLDHKSFPLAVVEVYQSTPRQERGLRDVVINVALDQLRTLRISRAIQIDLLKQVPDFACDLCIAILERHFKVSQPGGVPYRDHYPIPQTTDDF